MDPYATNLRDALRRLHREKDAAYRDAWKRRGEVISILSNVARKVDRLEYVLNGAPNSRDEGLFDTAVDLLVCSVKYQTYLADLNTDVAHSLFDGSGLDMPYADGPAGFEYLLSRVDLSSADVDDQAVGKAVTAVLARFGALEACFVGMRATHPVSARLVRVQVLTEATACLVVALHREVPGLVG